MAALKTVAAAQERDVPEHVKTFNQAFMGSIARFWRLPELYSMMMFYLGTLNHKMALGDVGLMLPMVGKRKMKFVPRRVKGAAEVNRSYKKSMERAKASAKADLRADAQAVEAAGSGVRS